MFSKWLFLAAWLILAIATLRTAWRWRSSALVHAFLWAGLALLVNGAIHCLESSSSMPLAARYLGLVLALCVPIAVLGARYPGAGAWHFVVIGFAALGLLPVLEQPWGSPEWHLDGLRSALLAAVLALAWINYLPTRLVWFVSGLVWSAGWQLAVLATRQNREPLLDLADTCTLIGLWWAAGWSLVWHVRPVARAFFRARLAPVGNEHCGSARDTAALLEQIHTLWQELRDGWGLVWAWRILEMVQTAARHAQLPGEFTWSGISCRSVSSQNDTAASKPSRPGGLAKSDEATPCGHEQEVREALRKWLVLLEAVARRFAPPSSAEASRWLYGSAESFYADKLPEDTRER